MIVKAIRDMPQSEKWIFIVRQEYLDHYAIDRLIRREVSDPIFISVPGSTEGQACTALLADPHLSPEEPVFIAACDNGYLYDFTQFQKLVSDPTNSCVVWTFTDDVLVLNNPKAWGWVQLSPDGQSISTISCKEPISNSPRHDHAIIGSFYFSHASDFLTATHMMILENYRVNNEFYLDCVPIFLKKMKKKSVIFDVQLYVGFGTPDALHYYDQMEYYVTNSLDLKNDESIDSMKYTLWKEYLSKKITLDIYKVR